MKWFYASDQWHVAAESIGLCGAVIPTNFILLEKPNLRLYKTTAEFLDHFCEDCEYAWIGMGGKTFWWWEINFQKRRRE